MAPDAERPATVDSEGWWVIGMVSPRAVTVLAHDMGVWRLPEFIILVPVTILAVSDSPVLDPNLLPIRLVPFAVPSIHVASFPNTEILGHK
jgi:hypothetical protein